MIKETEILDEIIRKVESLQILNDFTNLVQWSDMQSAEWAIGETILIKETLNTKLIHNEYHMRFKTTIPTGKGFWPPHYHDFVERCKVIAGELSTPLMATITKIGGSLIVPAMQPHEPRNDSKDDCILIVDFVNTTDTNKALRFLRKIDAVEKTDI